MSTDDVGAEDNRRSVLADVRHRLDELSQRAIFAAGELDEYRQLAWLERELGRVFGG